MPEPETLPQPDPVNVVDYRIELPARVGVQPTAKSPPQPVVPPTLVPPPAAAPPKIVSAPPAAAPPPVPAPAPIAAPPPAAAPPKIVSAPGAAKPPTAAPPAAAPAASTPTPLPAPAKGAVPAEDITTSTPKEQIRRVVYLCTAATAKDRAAFATFLAQSAKTISKKPIFLRMVATYEVTPASDPMALYERARQAGAVAILAVIDNWPAQKIDALNESCTRGGILFRAVGPEDVQKKSLAVDVIVDMMLLPGEN